MPNVRMKSQPVPTHDAQRGFGRDAACRLVAEAVHDLVHGAVAADRDDELLAGRQRLAGQLRGVPADSLSALDDVEAVAARRRRDLRPLAAGAAAVGGGIDHEDGAPSGHRRGGSASGRADGELGHPVDGVAQLLVGDAHELADHEVRDAEHAAGGHAAEGADREQHGGLHLDRQHAAVAPALVATRSGS